MCHISLPSQYLPLTCYCSGYQNDLDNISPTESNSFQQLLMLYSLGTILPQIHYSARLSLLFSRQVHLVWIELMIMAKGDETEIRHYHILALYHDNHRDPSAISITTLSLHFVDLF